MGCEMCGSLHTVIQEPGFLLSGPPPPALLEVLHLLHVMSREAVTKGGVPHFHSHSIDQSSVIGSPNYEAGWEMQTVVCPGRRGKNMTVAGTVGAVSATLDPLSSFPPL